jgi:hypothetical protein
MAPVTRLAAHRASVAARRERIVTRARRSLIGGSRASPRLLCRRWESLAAFCAADSRRAGNFNRRMAGYVWERMATMNQDGSDSRFGRRMVRLMTRFPELVDASPDMRRLLDATRMMNSVEGRSQERVKDVYRRIGSTGYYCL